MMITIIVLKAVSAPVHRESLGRHKETAPALPGLRVKIGGAAPPPPQHQRHPHCRGLNIVPTVIRR